MTKKRILYIQHSGALGGSVMSLLYTMQALNKQEYEPIVALARPSTELINFYQQAGFETIPWEGITLWDHSTVAPKPLYAPSTWKHLAKAALNWKKSKQRTLELVEFVKPDIVHLNSMPLSSSAEALIEAGIPTVWHVREPPFPDRGLRYQKIRSLMMRVNELIFISESDRQAWVQGERGVVVHNFVDFDRFSQPTESGEQMRNKLGISKDAPVLLYVGGLTPIKGSFVLLEALGTLKKDFPNLRCLMLGFDCQSSGRLVSNIARALLPLVGYGTLSQRIVRKIDELQLHDICVQLPFEPNIVPFYAACDILVFPATKPHFARPIIEAGAMSKPVVASRLGGAIELVQDGETGLLVNPSDYYDLANSISKILENNLLSQQMGRDGFIKAKDNFAAEYQIAKITDVYRKLFK